MKITWLGHACFKIEGDKTTVLTDPYDASVGYPVRKTRADYVTVSHKHRDHCDLSWVEGATVVENSGCTQFGDITFLGMQSHHDDQNGTKRGSNIIFKFTVDDISICHMGDIGHIPDDKLWKAIGRVDVLMIPVGGFYTIDAVKAKRIIGMVEPFLTIAMHYRNEACGLPIDEVGPFLELMGGRRVAESTIGLGAGALREYKGVIAMDWVR